MKYVNLLSDKFSIRCFPMIMHRYCENNEIPLKGNFMPAKHRTWLNIFHKHGITYTKIKRTDYGIRNHLVVSLGDLYHLIVYYFFVHQKKIDSFETSFKYLNAALRGIKQLTDLTVFYDKTRKWAFLGKKVINLGDYEYKKAIRFSLKPVNESINELIQEKRIIAVRSEKYTFYWDLEEEYGTSCQLQRLLKSFFRTSE